MLAGVNWDSLLVFAFLSLFLVVATLLRSRISILQRFLIPNSILAGVLGIIFGQYVFKVIDPNRMGDYVYHLLTLAFIAMGLRGSRVKRSYGTVTTMVVHCKGYAMQGLLGMIFTLVVILTYMPRLFPAFGLHLVMGYGNNPGVAYSFGQAWEAMGFTGGAQVGLTFGALGFVWAYIVGIMIINWGVRRNKTALFKGYHELPASVFKGVVGRDEPKKEAGKLVTSAEAVESLALQLAIVGTVFLAAYYFLRAVIGGLDNLGETGHDLAKLIGGFGFIFGILFALLLRWIMELLRIDHVIDQGLMSRLGGTFVDYMIAASVAAISLSVIRAYWLEIAVLSTLGGLATLALVLFLVKRMHRDFHFERALSSFGLLTGTVASGLALLRVVDPHFETPVAEDLVYAGGLALFTGIPILLLANMPAAAYLGGESLPGLIKTIILVAAYVVVLFIGWKIYQVLFLRRLKRAGEAGAVSK